jgi:hypothetical protein
MSIGFGLKLQMASAGLGMALVSGGCTMMAPKGEYVAPPLGSTWVLARSDSGSFGTEITQMTAKKEERMWEGKPTAATVSPQGTTLVNSDGAWLAILSPDGEPIFSWDPPIGFDFPLVVGKTWAASYRMTVHAENQTIPFDSRGKVEAYENVTVPAGTFKAFKISSSTTLGDENVHWFSPEFGVFVKSILVRTDESPAGPGKRETEIVSQTIEK